jgi:predicted dienelactone hydrolase
MARFSFLFAAFGLGKSLAHAAGFQFIEIPGDDSVQPLNGAVWYPCNQPPGNEKLGPFVLSIAKDCPVIGEKLPLVVISHGRGGSFLDHNDTAEALAKAGFVVVAINHPGDNALDNTRTDDFSVFVERPADIKRLIDFMLGSWTAAAKIDESDIGIFGFSRGGYTGLVAAGANPYFGKSLPLCDGVDTPLCAQVHKGELPELVHDPRIKKAVIADPVSIFFAKDSFSNMKTPVQLWRSELGGGGVTPESVADIIDEMPTKPDVHFVPNSQHFSFMAPCSPEFMQSARAICVDGPDFDRVSFHRVFNAEVVAFFRKHQTDTSKSETSTRHGPR